MYFSICVPPSKGGHESPDGASARMEGRKRPQRTAKSSACVFCVPSPGSRAWILMGPKVPAGIGVTPVSWSAPALRRFGPRSQANQLLIPNLALGVSPSAAPSSVWSVDTSVTGERRAQKWPPRPQIRLQICATTRRGRTSRGPTPDSQAGGASPHCGKNRFRSGVVRTRSTNENVPLVCTSCAASESPVMAAR